MLIVIDTSVVIAVITNEKHKNELIKHTIGADLISPPSLHWEICNAFSAMFKRKKITLNQAKDAIEYYLKIPIRFIDIELKNVLTITLVFLLNASSCCSNFLSGFTAIRSAKARSSAALALIRF